MASYLCSLKEWTTSELAATGSIIGKSTAEPTAPSEETLVKSNSVGKKNVGIFNVPTLAGGEVVVAATLHVYAKVAVEGKSLKVAFVSPAVAGEPNVKVASAWLSTVSLSQAQAEALTQAALNALACQLEIVLGKSTSIYEVYLALETTTAGSPVNLAGTIAVTLGGSASVTDRVGLGGTVAVRTGNSGSATDRVGLGGTVAVRIGSSASATEKIGLGGSIAVRLSPSGSPTTKVGLGGAIKVTFGASGSITTKSGAAISLAGTIAVAVGAQAKVRSKLGLGGTIKVTTGGSGSVTTSTGQRSGVVVYTSVVLGQKIPLKVQLPQPLPVTTLIE